MMIKYLFPAIFLLGLHWSNQAISQNNQALKQGRVVYEQQIKGNKTSININGSPQTVTTADFTRRWEVLFSPEHSLKRAIETDRPESGMEVGGISGFGNIKVMSAALTESIIWHHFTEQRKLEQREAIGKTYLIEDSISRHTWKLTGETKTVLGYTCQKAITHFPQKSYNMQMQNGEFSRTEKWDTIDVVVWFTPAITIPAGPDFQGELPGLILETESRNGTSVIRAVEISPAVKLSELKEPKSGKKITRPEFEKTLEASQKEMLQNTRPFRVQSF